MRLCQQCQTGYPDNLAACPIHGGPLSEISDLQPGMLVRNTYRITRKLGQGGMGAVYLAEQTLLGEPQVLKFLSPQLSQDQELTDSFLREVRTLRQIRHRNVVHAGNVEPAEDGTLFYSMEFVDGPDLLSFLRQAPKPFDVALALQITRGIAEGLGAAHALGMVHRDIKPENILMGREGESWIPKIADFGIVATKENHRRTQVGMSMLTPVFAAPEQWLGAPSSELDGRTDLYALGGVLFEMLTGQNPFAAGDNQGWSEKHIHAAPRPPSHVRPELAEWKGLDGLVLRLLAKDRNDRPKDVAEFLGLLDGVFHDAAGMTDLPAPPAKSVLAATQQQVPSPEPAREPDPIDPPAGWSHPEPLPIDASLEPLQQTPPGEPATEAAANLAPPVRWTQNPERGKGGIPPSGKTGFRRFSKRVWFWSIVGVVAAALLVQRILVPPVPSRSLDGHTDAVFAVAFSPNSLTLASGSRDKTVQFWNVRDGKPLSNLRDEFESLAVSPDGSTVAAGTGDNSIKLWDVSSGAILVTMQGHTDLAGSVAFSPDGHTLASGSLDLSVKLWDVTSGQAVRTMNGHTGPVLSVAFSRDGRLVASASADQTIRLWDAGSGRLVRTLREHTGAVNSVAFSPDGRTLASASDDGTIMLWDAASGAQQHTLARHTGAVYCVAFSGDSRMVASGGADNTVKLWDVATGEMLRSLRGHSAAVLSIAFSPFGSVIASGSADRSIRLWNVAEVRE